MKFEDITPQCVVKFENEPEGFNADQEYTVESISTNSNGKLNYITMFTGPDDYGESDGYLEGIDEEYYTSCGGSVVKEVTDKQKLDIIELDNLIASIGSMASLIKKKAKKSGLSYDVVVLSDTDDLANWYSSRC